MERNEKIRNELKSRRLYLYELAEAADISEPTIVRWMREPLTDDRYARLLAALESLKGGVVNA